MSAALGEAQSGKLIAEQLQEAWPSVLFLSAVIIYASCKGAKREPFGKLQCALGMHCAHLHYAGRAMPEIASGLSGLRQYAVLAGRRCHGVSTSYMPTHAVMSASPYSLRCARTGICCALMSEWVGQRQPPCLLTAMSRSRHRCRSSWHAAQVSSHRGERLSTAA